MVGLRNGMVALSSVIALVASVMGARAQQPPGQPAEVQRYLTFTEGQMGDLPTPLNGVVKFSRTGNRPPDLALDLCFPPRADVTSADRVTAPLAVNRALMTASGTSQVGRVPTTVRIETRQDKGRLMLKGEIAYGDRTLSIEEQPVEYQDGPAPEAYRNVFAGGAIAPNEVVALVPIAAIRTALDVARQQKAGLPPNQLIAGCDDLRAGQMILRLTTAGRSVPALAAALKRIPGVETSVAESYSREDGVRLPVALKTVPDDRIVRDFAESARRVLGSETPPSIKARPETGDFVILVSRDTPAARALGLREVVVITAMVAPEIGSDKGDVMLYVMQVGSGFLDGSPNPLTIQQDLTESTTYTDLSARRTSLALIRTFAAEQKGEAREGSGRH